jgi:hypothetical protein
MSHKSMLYANDFIEWEWFMCSKQLIFIDFIVRGAVGN